MSNSNQILDRRSCERTFCGKSGLLFFSRHRGFCPCYVRDITDVGAGIRLQHLPLLPIDFLLSLDQFKNARICRLRWRDGDFAGAAFEALAPCDHLQSVRYRTPRGRGR
jgi:hypothetical protein